MSCLWQTDNDYYTVVATSRNAKDIGDCFKPAMNGLFATLPGGGKLVSKQLPITEEPDPDFFSGYSIRTTKASGLPVM